MKTPALILTLVAACAACDSRPQRFPIGFDRMRDQPRYDVYEPSRFFGDGKVMQAPPDGAVPVENAATASEDAAAITATVIPVPVTTAGISHGRNRYDIFCAPCHDLDGGADSPVARNLQLRHPPSLLDVRIRQLPVGRIYQAISQGYGLMPSYAHQLLPGERWDVVAYVRALQLRTAVPLERLPPTVRAEAAQSLRGATR